MTYKVLAKFKDLQDKTAHVYDVGDDFPYDGRVVSKTRITELMGKTNKLKKALIEEIKPKKVIVKETTAKEVKKDEEVNKGN